MSVHRIRPEVVASTHCPNDHVDEVEAIDPVVEGGEYVEAFWPSAYEYCMACDEPVQVTSIEVRR